MTYKLSNFESGTETIVRGFLILENFFVKFLFYNSAWSHLMVVGTILIDYKSEYLIKKLGGKSAGDKSASRQVGRRQVGRDKSAAASRPAASRACPKV